MGANTRDYFAKRGPPEPLVPLGTMHDVAMCDAIWTFNTNEHGTAYADDGRLMVFEGHSCLIMPAPAASLLMDIKARKCAREGNNHGR